MERVRVIGTALGVMVWAATAWAQTGALVATSWVAEQLTSPDLVLLHVGPAPAYQQAHLPGARLVSLADLSVPAAEADGLNLQMASADRLRDALQKLGISATSRIVVYHATPQAITQATRVVFALNVAGLGARTHLMDGGLALWTTESRPTTTDVPTVTPGTLAPFTLRPEIADYTFVSTNLTTPGIKIVDARAPAFYNGTQTGGTEQAPHLTGHIEGATNVPFSALTNPDGRFKSLEELRALFTAAGIAPTDTVVTYCHIGQQASATAFAARLLGHTIKLYDGSFEEWSRNKKR